MNDAGLDEPINSAFSQVKENEQSVDADEKVGKNMVGPLQALESSTTTDARSPAYANTRASRKVFSSQQPTWWFASTGFPLIAGTFGPIANAFSICALVETWRFEIPPGGTASQGRAVPDPKWLIAVNAVSLALALIANLALLLNMARKISISIAQPVTIVGFWASSVILIVLIVVASLELHEFGKEGQVLTQAYYFACWAAGIYQIISYMLCVTVYGAVKQKYDREFRLTTAQRSLMLQTILFLGYMLFGALIYTKIEGWKYTDAVYWAAFTLLTIGIGDYAPTTHLGRSLLFPFAIGGIVALGLIVSSIRSLVIDRGKQNVAARLTDSMRRRLLAEVDNIQQEHKRKKGLTILNNELKQKIASGPTDDEDELDRREAEFEAMRRVQYLSDRRQKWLKLLSSTTAFAILWLVGALVFSHTERNQQSWSYFVSLYFSYTSLLTIGYGDIYPVSDSGKAFFVFWALLAIPSLTILISDMGDTVIKFVKDITIYLGELTILPSEEGDTLERLRYGLRKVTRGSGRASSTPSPDQDDQRNNPADPNGQRQRSTGVTQTGAQEQNPTHFETLRALEENMDGTQIGDRRAESSSHISASTSASKPNQQPPRTDTNNDRRHQNRHEFHNLLLSQIRRVYIDSTRSTPKKYAYHEWAFFLKILGEDERDPSFHRIPHADEQDGHDGHDGYDGNDRHDRHSEHGGHEHDMEGDQSASEHKHSRRNTTETKPKSKTKSKPNTKQNEAHPVQKWSWLGPHSPLLSDKTEAALLLDLLFQRMEESLKER